MDLVASPKNARSKWTNSSKVSEDASTKSAQLVKELRTKYLAEREELLSSVDSQTREMSLELLQVRNSQGDCDRQVEHLTERLNAIETEAEIPGAEEALNQACRTLQSISAEMKQCTDETQLLKVALLDDQYRREQRQKQMEMEDESFKLRLSQLEDQNEFLRAELQRIRSANAEPLAKVCDLLHSVSHSDAPSAFNAKYLESKQLENESALCELQEKLLKLEGTLSSLEQYQNELETKRRDQVEQLDRTVTDIRNHQQLIKRDPYPKNSQFNIKNMEEESLSFIANALLPAQQSTTPSTTTPKQESSYILARSYEPTSNTAAIKESTLNTIRQRLVDFYSIYNPSKIDTMDDILDEYNGAETELFSALEAHYGAFGYFSMY